MSAEERIRLAHNLPPEGLNEKLIADVEDILVNYGGRGLLKAVGYVLQGIEGAGSAACVGRSIEALAEVDW